MSGPGHIADDYVAAQASFVALAADLAPDDWVRPVVCCPGWTVRDVLSHVAGLADDVLAGRVEGAASPAWTAAQVERWRDASVEDLVRQWSEQSPQVAALLDAIGESRPPVDCTAHEHDVRHAVGRPGNRDGPIVVTLAAELRGSAGTPIPAGLTPFEIFRSRLGRRSAAQVRAYDWDVPVDDETLRRWFLFGPSATDIVE